MESPQSGGGDVPQIRFSPSQAPGDFVQAISAAAEGARAVAATAINHSGLSRLVDLLDRHPDLAGL